MKQRSAIVTLTALALIGTGAAPSMASEQAMGYEVGTVVSVHGSVFTLRDATNGHIITVNRHTAIANSNTAGIASGNRVVLRGHFMQNGVFDAMSIQQHSAQRGSEVVTVDQVRGDDLSVTDSTNGKRFIANTYTAARSGRVDVGLNPGARVRLDGYWLPDGVFDVEHAVAAVAEAPASGFLVGTVTGMNGSIVMLRDASNWHMLRASVANTPNAGAIRVGERVRFGGRWLSNGIYDVDSIRVL